MFELTSPALVRKPALPWSTRKVLLSEQGMKQLLGTPVLFNHYSVSGPTNAGMKPDPGLIEMKGKFFFP